MRMAPLNILAVPTMSSLRRAVVALFAVVAIGGIIDGVFGQPLSDNTRHERAADNELAFMAAVLQRANKQLICGGSIVGPRHVLTAGHCVKEKDAEDIAVRLGAHNPSGTNDNLINVERIVTHNDYNLQSHPTANNLAILVLERDIPFGENVKKIQVTAQKPKQQDNEKTYVAAGWDRSRLDGQEGNTDLKKVNIKLSDTGNCWSTFIKDDLVLCGYQATESLCDHDDGGPLIEDGKLVGIVSSFQCVPRIHNTFVNVFRYRQWISDVIRNSH